jgi:hypothetical protein
MGKLFAFLIVRMKGKPVAQSCERGLKKLEA